MDQRLRRWTPRLLLFSVLAVLLAVGVLQHQWFSRSAAIEIDNAFRSLESSVRQSVFREFQRYAPLVAAAREFQTRGPMSDSRYRVFVDDLLSAYGPTGTAPGLIAAAGLLRPGQPALVRRGDRWSPVADAPWKLDAERSGRGPLFLSDGPEAAESVLVVRPETAKPGLLLFLDLDNFFSVYVRPAVAEIIPDAAVSWRPQRRGPDPGFDPRSFSFNPLMALVSHTSVPPTLTVGISRLLGPPSPEFRFPAPVVLDILLPPDASVLGIERRLAWNWLSGVLLLAALAAAFTLTLGQWGRLAELRRRERDFVASVSHELRTPLTVIRSAADNFTRGIVPAERQGRYGRLILDQSVRLGRMIEEMLAFAQAEAAPAPVHSLVDFDRWLAELRPPLETLAAERNVALTWESDLTSGRTDAEALRMILENLVVNALNHAYPDRSAVRQVHVSLKQRAGRLELAVEDQGRGIAPQEAKKVFEPFYRDQFSRTHQEKGSGLGLFLALRQAKRLGGTLKLESPWRKGGVRHSGCRFVLEAPLESDRVR